MSVLKPTLEIELIICYTREELSSTEVHITNTLSKSVSDSIFDACLIPDGTSILPIIPTNALPEKALDAMQWRGPGANRIACAPQGHQSLSYTVIGPS